MCTTLGSATTSGSRLAGSMAYTGAHARASSRVQPPGAAPTSTAAAGATGAQGVAAGGTGAQGEAAGATGATGAADADAVAVAVVVAVAASLEGPPKAPRNQGGNLLGNRSMHSCSCGAGVQSGEWGGEGTSGAAGYFPRAQLVQNGGV